MTSLLAGAAAVALATGAARAADGPLVQVADPYFVEAQDILKQALAAQPNTNRAKNVILFVGDGMGISTVTAARIFEGQQRGVDGVSNQLAFDAFPHVALSKTYSSDAQVTELGPQRHGDDDRRQAQERHARGQRAGELQRLRQRHGQQGHDAGGNGRAGRNVDRGDHDHPDHARHSGRHLLPHAEP